MMMMPEVVKPIVGIGIGQRMRCNASSNRERRREGLFDEALDRLAVREDCTWRCAGEAGGEQLETTEFYETIWKEKTETEKIKMRKSRKKTKGSSLRDEP